jgi:hypothetical protein
VGAQRPCAPWMHMRHPLRGLFVLEISGDDGDAGENAKRKEALRKNESVPRHVIPRSVPARGGDTTSLRLACIHLHTLTLN